jgi:hypothetical protein
LQIPTKIDNHCLILQCIAGCYLTYIEVIVDGKINKDEITYYFTAAKDGGATKECETSLRKGPVPEHQDIITAIILVLPVVSFEDFPPANSFLCVHTICIVYQEYTNIITIRNSLHHSSPRSLWLFYN